MPVLSLYLLYSLEGFFTDTLLRQLEYQARLAHAQAVENPALLDNPQTAQKFMQRIAKLTDARVILLGQDATILASTRAEDADRIGQRHSDASVAQALRGEMAQGVGPGFGAEVAYVVLPLERDGVTQGALRVSYEVTDMRAQFSQLQWLVLGGVVLTAILGLALGIGLATTITRPLRQLSEGAESIAAGDYRARVNAASRDEVGVLARSFNRMAERLEEAEQTRQRQLASIVHELARPLTVMRAAVETLRELKEGDREMSETLHSSLEEEFARLERLLGTLEGLHQRALRPIRLNRSAISIERVIRAIVANYEPLARQAGIALGVQILGALPLIHADEDRLIQVLTNLIDNAFKFTPRGGQIAVHAGIQNGAVWAQVADTGTGIAPDELPHVFEQFYSGDASRPPEKRGMGLGLAICREIVKAHRGEIQVESEFGKGARFTVYLPIT